MHHWRDLWPFLKTGWHWLFLAVPVAITALGVYVALPKISDTNNWIADTFLGCSKVRLFLAESLSPIYLTQHGPKEYAIAKSVQEISVAVRMSEERVLKCLKRLKKKSVVVPEGDKWKIKLPN